MPTELKERLKKQKYYMTSNIHIMTFLATKGIIPYNVEYGEHDNNKNKFFYGNSSKLRACLHEYYNNLEK